MQEEAVIDTWNITRHTKNLKHEQQPEWSRTIHKISKTSYMCTYDYMHHGHYELQKVDSVNQGEKK